MSIEVRIPAQEYQDYTPKYPELIRKVNEFFSYERSQTVPGKLETIHSRVKEHVIESPQNRMIYPNILRVSNAFVAFDSRVVLLYYPAGSYQSVFRDDRAIGIVTYKILTNKEENSDQLRNEFYIGEKGRFLHREYLYHQGDSFPEPQVLYNPGSAINEDIIRSVDMCAHSVRPLLKK